MMPLRQQTGNMYNFVTHTWNPIRGRCIHDCSYCYMKRFPLPDLHLDKKDLKTDLGAGNFIFIGSGTDMWAEDVPKEWIEEVTRHCFEYDENTYLFQSKNPQRMYNLQHRIHNKSVVVGTTIETNRDYQLSKAPTVGDRARAMFDLDMFRRMVTIEPIADFDLDELLTLIEYCHPDWVNIGADSKGSKLPEPSAENVQALIAGLKEFTEVKQKRNLNRLLIT